MYNSVPVHIDHIAADHIFWEIVVYFFQITEFSWDTIFRQYISYLDIKLLLRPISTLIKSWSINGHICSRYNFCLIISIQFTSNDRFVLVIADKFITINFLSFYKKTIFGYS